MNHAIYEELEAKETDRARQVYRASLDIIPNLKFAKEMCKQPEE